ncbi:MAG: hypothetical protein M3O82_00195 [Verrucomicrobiota bacterium]|nr:hypothetical protein [Verrucomicrobiota bacterium]
MSARRWEAALFCVSAALLGFELLLMRLLTLAYWGHFAAFVISIAMLGIAVSGLFLHFQAARITANPEKYFLAAACGIAISAPLSFFLAQRLPFAPFLLAWSAREYGYLATRVFLLFIPFFLGGIAIGVPFVARLSGVARLYFANMLGSAATCIPLFGAMSFLHPVPLLAAVAALAFVGALLCEKNSLRAVALACFGAVVAGIYLTMPFAYSEYKDLPKTLLLPDAKITDKQYSAAGVVETVDAPSVRYLPGLSLNFTGTLPPSKLVFTDGSAMEVAFEPAKALAAPQFLRMSPEAFAFAAPASSVLLLYGGPADVLRALASGTTRIVAVDDIPARVRSLEKLWPQPPAHLERVIDEARHFLATHREGYDVIQLSLLGSHGASTAGAASLDPSFVLTREGFSLLLRRLNPGGEAVISAWVENPARSGVRLAALIVAALQERGVTDPARHIFALRGWSTIAFFVKSAPADAQEIDLLKKFADENSFDLVFYPGMAASEANQKNVIPDEPYYAALSELTGPAAQYFMRDFPFNLAPPRDDSPFFNNYFRWGAVPHFISELGRDWLPFVEWGYLLHIAGLVVATALGVCLLIVPCFLSRASIAPRSGLLFFLLGMAYMFVEIWAIYRSSQLLAQPALAPPVVLTTMLAASGAGALVLSRRNQRPRAIALLIPAAVFILLVLLSLCANALFAQPLWVRVIAAVCFIGVPAFLMGFPYPYSLANLDNGVPWALALNGFGSVIGSMAATLVAVHFGFTALALGGALLYAASAPLLRR